MRFAVDARPLAHPNTGIGRYTTALLKRLLKLTPDDQWFLYCDRPLNRIWRENPDVTVRTGRAAGPVGHMWCTQVSYSLWARRDRIDVFWSPRHHLPRFLPRRVREVVTIHDLVWKRFPETMMPDNLQAERNLMPAALQRADAIIAVSEFTASELTQEFSGLCPISVIHESGFDEGTIADLPETNIPAGHPYFLFVGTLEPRKNLRILLLAMSELIHQRGVPVRLVIVGGKGWGGQDVVAWAKELQIEDAVVHLGVVGRSMLHRVYSDALALAMPSLYEGFGIPAVEAMQYGLPVIAGRSGSLPEVLGYAGVLVDPENVQELANAMEGVAMDCTRRGQLAQAATRRAQDFSWHSAAQKTLAVLTGIEEGGGQ